MAGNKSRYYDALAQASAQLQHRPGRHVIVMLSDGLDSTSRASRQQALEAVTRAGATVFVVEWKTVLRNAIYEDAVHADRDELDQLPEIVKVMLTLLSGIGFSSGTGVSLGLGDYLECLDRIWEHGSVELHNLAEVSGGEVFNPPDFEHLLTVADKLHREIKAQFSLTFIAERRVESGKERHVQVIPARPGLSVRVRRTYYTGDDARQ